MQSWIPLFHQQLDTSIVNAYILLKYWRKTKLEHKKRFSGTLLAFQRMLVNNLLQQLKNGDILARIVGFHP